MERKDCLILNVVSRGQGCSADAYPEVNCTTPPISFYRLREGATFRKSTVTSQDPLKSVTGDPISVILIALSTVNLQFQGQFVSLSLRPIP